MAGRHPRVDITLLNHASALIRAGDVSLLSDPWYSGVCFGGNWGLQFQNDAALDRAAGATHLWISHPHEDHFHRPTLARLAAQSPGIRVLGNVSANHSMKGTLAKLGFASVQGVPERSPLTLAPGFVVTRYPTGGIDNALLMEIEGFRVLNLNDGNLPRAALSRLVRRMGRVDVLMTSFTHAHKLVPCPPDDEVEAELLERFSAIVDAVDPRFVVPFASYHAYRAPGTIHQNRTMLSAGRLRGQESRVVPLEVGDGVRFEAGADPVVSRCAAPARRIPTTARSERESIPMPRLEDAAQRFLTRLRQEFAGFVGWMGRPSVRVIDHDRVLVLDPRHGCRVLARDAHADVEIHSDSLWQWLSSPYGTDSLLVGGDFDLVARQTNGLGAIARMILAGALVDSRLSPRSALSLLRRKAGRRFFWNRREEIFWTLLGLRLHVGNRT